MNEVNRYLDPEGEGEAWEEIQEHFVALSHSRTVYSLEVLEDLCTDISSSPFVPFLGTKSPSDSQSCPGHLLIGLLYRLSMTYDHN